MKQPAVRVVPNREGTWFEVRHWRKHVAGSDDWREADQMAKEFKAKLDLRSSICAQKKSDDAARRQHEDWASRTIPESDLDTWQEDFPDRDPNAPTEALINHYEGNSCTKQRMLVPPGHPFHWTTRYRTGWAYCDGKPDQHWIPGERSLLELAEDDAREKGKVYRGSRCVLPSLPKIPYEELIPIRATTDIAVAIEVNTHNPRPTVATNEPWSAL